MALRCEPGDTCVIIGEGPGCECNIGAVLMVTEIDPTDPSAWLFKGATRPLLMLPLLLEDGLSYAVSSYDDTFFFYSILDKYLRPVRDKGKEDQVTTAKDLELES